MGSSRSASSRAGRGPALRDLRRRLPPPRRRSGSRFERRRRARHRRSAAGRRRGRHGDVDYQPDSDRLIAAAIASNLLRHMTEKLGDNEYLFTSESVTEGHPDKVADQISDGVLDAVLADDPSGRVACETLVNTGLVVVSGEISTDDLRRHPGDRPRDDPQDRLHRRRPRLLGRLLRGDQRDRQAVARHRPGRRQRARDADRPADDDELDVAGAGDQGMMFGYASRRDAGADADADLARPQARPAAGRGAQGRQPSPYLRPDGKTQVTVRYDERPPGRDREGADLDPARRRRSTATRRSAPTSGSTSCSPILPGRALRRAQAQHEAELPRQPDRPLRDRRPGRRRRPHRPQDHRRHLRRHGPPRRRRLLRQGPVEGRPLGRLRGALGGQERGRRRARRPLRGPGRLRDRRRPPGLA